MPYQKLLKELWALDSMYTNGIPTIPYHSIYGILYYTTIRIISYQDHGWSLLFYPWLLPGAAVVTLGDPEASSMIIYQEARV